MSLTGLDARRLLRQWTESARQRRAPSRALRGGAALVGLHRLLQKELVASVRLTDARRLGQPTRGRTCERVLSLALVLTQREERGPKVWTGACAGGATIAVLESSHALGTLVGIH